MRTPLVVAVAACLLWGCSRTGPLIRDFRKSADAAFATQRARTVARPAEAVSGLDSQEAAITSDNYRAGLAPKGKEAKEEPTILVAPPSRERPPPLAPSVPKE